MGIAAYIGLDAVIPALLPPLFMSLGLAVKSIAWVPLAVFSFCGLVSFLRARTTPVPRRSAGGPSVGKRANVTPVADAGMKMDVAWGRSAAGNMASPGPSIAEASHPDQPQAAPAHPDLWSLEALRRLEWKRFELVCARYYELAGFRSETLRCGPDGGVDIKLFRADPQQPMAVVQCKAWNSAQVGVAPVRELLGVMTSEKVGRGVFMTTSTFTADAKEFARSNPIQLLDGQAVVDRFLALPDAMRASLLHFAFDGDYSTPNCPSCGTRTVKRQGRRGVFWGCINFPRCKTLFPVRE